MGETPLTVTTRLDTTLLQTRLREDEARTNAASALHRLGGTANRLEYSNDAYELEQAG